MPRARTTGIVLPEIKMCKSSGCANIATGYNGHCYSCDSQSSLRCYSASPIPRRTIKNPMGVEIECYNPETVSKVTHVARFVCRDGSLPSGGGEIKLCGPEAKLENIAADTVQRSRIVGNMVNKKCGLHVHMKIEQIVGRGRGLETCNRLFKFAKAMESFMFDISPGSRVNNIYCRKLEDVYSLVRHHSWISLSDRYPTVEIRIHGGTMNPWKVKGWINAWMQIRPYIDQVASGASGWEDVVTKVSGNGVLNLLDQNSIGYRYLKARETSDGTLYNFGFNTAVRPQARSVSETPELAPEDNPFPQNPTRQTPAMNSACVSELLLDRATESPNENTLRWRYRNAFEGIICTNFNRDMAHMHALADRWIGENSSNGRDFFPAGSLLHRMWMHEGEIYILVEYMSDRFWVKMRNLPTYRVFS